MKNKRFIIFSLFVLMICIISAFPSKDVLAQPITISEKEIYSNYVIDAESIEIEGKIYTALLNNDLLYIIDDMGNVVKKINYFPSEDYLYKLTQSGFVFNKNYISLEIIDDIDGKGFSDFMIIFQEHVFENVNSVMTISYESGEVLWGYTPSMTSVKICGFNEYCEESVDIKNYKINDHLYVAAGYKVEEIDLKTGKIINTFVYENNIWDLEIVSDLNDDGIEDIAISVQPSKIVTIDRKTFIKINEMEVSLSKELKDSIILKTNVWSIVYLPTRDILVGLSEDGYIYEISLKENRILNSIQLFEFNIFNYSNIFDANSSEFETYKEGTKTYYFLGNELRKSQNMKVSKTISIDNDQYEDYMVRFVPPGSRIITFIRCTSENSLDLNARRNYEFLGTDGKVVAYKDGIGLVRIVDLKTNALLVYEYDQIFGERDEFTDRPVFYVNIVSDGFIISLNNVQFIKFGSEGTKADPEWTVNQVVQQSFEQTDNRLIVFDNIVNYKIGFRIFDKDLNVIESYKSDKKLISKHYIIENYLYIFEVDKTNHYYTVFDLNDGKRVYYSILSDTLTGVSKPSVLSFDENYADVNDDGFSEVLVRLRYFNNLESKIKYKLLIVDIKNNSIVDEFDFDTEQQIKQVFTINDINGDSLPEFILYFKNNKETIFRIFKTSTSDILNDSDVIEQKYNVDLTNHFISQTIDLNNDGYQEVIFDHNIEFSDPRFQFIENKLFFFDFQAGKVTPYVNSIESEYTSIFLKTEDLEDDGIKELVMIDAKRSDATLSRYPIVLRILNYIDGEFKVKYEKEINVGNLVLKSSYPANIAAFYDINNDDVKDIIMFSADYRSNIQIEAFDYKTSELIKKQSFNTRSKIKDVQLDEKNHFYKRVDIFNFKDNSYVLIKPSGKYDFFNVILDAKNLEIWAYVGSTYQGEFNDYFIFKDRSSINISKPVHFDSINAGISGIFKNIFKLKVNNVKVDNIKIYYETMSYTEYDGNQIEVSLPEEDYDIIFMIETVDGGIFYYSEVFTIKDSFGQTLQQITLILLFVTVVFMGSKYIISKKYFQK